MSIHSRVININTLKKGEVVGYGAKFKARKDTFIATIEVGHADGITEYFNKVKINNKVYNVVAVCMDYIMAEVDSSVKLYDSVNIIDNTLTIASVAANANDSIHHILVSITNRLPRKYIENNKEKIIM